MSKPLPPRTPSRPKRKDRIWSAKKRIYSGAATYIKNGDIEVVIVARNRKILEAACRSPFNVCTFSAEKCGRAIVKVTKA